MTVKPLDACDHCGSPLDERPSVALDRERLHVICLQRRGRRPGPRYGDLEPRGVRPFWEPADG